MLPVTQSHIVARDVKYQLDINKCKEVVKYATGCCV